MRTVAIPEAEWRPEDVALLLASRADEQERDENGIPWSEATDPANAEAFKGQELPRINFATKARLDAQDAYYAIWDTKESKANRNGHVWGVTKK